MVPPDFGAGAWTTGGGVGGVSLPMTEGGAKALAIAGEPPLASEATWAATLALCARTDASCA